MEHLQLGCEPRLTRADLNRLWFSMDSPFASRYEFEMFDGIGNVNVAALDSGLFERAVQQLAGGAYERLTGAIFVVAGLLADENHPRPHTALSEDGLRRVLVEIATAALGRRLS